MYATPLQINCHNHNPDFVVGFRLVKCDKGAALLIDNMRYNHLVFVLKGEVEIALDDIYQSTFSAGDMAYLPANYSVTGTAINATELLLLTHDNSVVMCDRVNTGQLKESIGLISFEFKALKMRQPLKEYLDLLMCYLDQGLACSAMLKVKQQELFLLLQHYYTVEQRVMFFYLSTFKNNDFMSQIMANYKLVKSAEELSVRCGYNIMTFHRLFKQNTGQTPYKWMLQQQSGVIRSRLVDSNMSLKDIAAEFRFSSISHLCTYTKRYLGATPMKIRKEARG